MKLPRRFTVLIAAVAACSAAVGLLHPVGDLRNAPRKGLDTLLGNTQIPAAAKSVLIDKCANCHSSETRWPIYSRFAPVSWLVERDVEEARRKIDFSTWNGREDADAMAGQIVSQARSNKMPPLQYRMVHWSAQITKQDIAALETMQTGVTGATGAGNSGDAARGGIVFRKRCSGCHAADESREGPPLRGVFGRRAGSVAGFDYSADMRKSGLIWNEDSLVRWLTDPDVVVRDNKMDFQLPSAQERLDVIAFLKQLQ